MQGNCCKNKDTVVKTGLREYIHFLCIFVDGCDNHLQTEDTLMNELLEDVNQGYGSGRSGLREGSREGRRRGGKGIETNEARKE